MSSERQKNIIGIALLAFFTILLIAGVLNKEMNTVFSKAASICLECIGIG